MTSSHSYKYLSEADVDHFLQYGYLRLKNCFTRAQAEELTASVWTRLGMSPTDKSTWTNERVHMPWHTEFDVAEFAPKAWNAICDLIGGESGESGESRIASEHRTWKDSLIVNLGTPEGEGKDTTPHELDNWHVDGDFFVHYLDSPEQGLLVIPLFSDIQPSGGGTVICPEAIGKIARHLYNNPEGVSPRMTPRAQNPHMEQEKGLSWYIELAKSCSPDGFVEATGEVGDVYLLHPLMLHSASNNKLRIPRLIANPPVSLREPFCFHRPDGAYSLIERKTLKELGKDRLEGWRIRADRERIVPARVKIQEEMKKKELERLQLQGTAA